MFWIDADAIGFVRLRFGEGGRYHHRQKKDRYPFHDRVAQGSQAPEWFSRPCVGTVHFPRRRRRNRLQVGLPLGPTGIGDRINATWQGLRDRARRNGQEVAKRWLDFWLLVQDVTILLPYPDWC